MTTNPKPDMGPGAPGGGDTPDVGTRDSFEREVDRFVEMFSARVTARARNDSDGDRLRRAVRIGLAVAAQLDADDDCAAAVAATKAGISTRTHYEWMAGTKPWTEAYQDIVTPAIHAQAERLMRKAEADVASSDGGSSAWSSWHRWKLEKRFPTIYGNLADAREARPKLQDGETHLGQLTVDEILKLLREVK